MSSNLPQQPQHKMVVYKAKDGQEVQLSIDIVRNYLVTGKKELVTVQEFVYFMGICKSRGLNPFARDCYLIKYTESDPAAIVTSIDFYRSRARAQADCTGWEKGVVCLNEKTGELRYSKGLVLPEEKLVGGWFKATPKGWDVPFELEVNLEGYIKRTKTGEITKFWRPENQPTMIAKVAESQGLRTLWPDEFRGTITAEEASLQLDNFETIDIEAFKAEEAPEPPPDTSGFDRLVEEKKLSPERLFRLNKFVAECAAANSRKQKAEVTAADIKVRAAANFGAFWQAFEAWEAKREEGLQSSAPGDGPPEEPEQAPPEAGQEAPEPSQEPSPAEELKAKLKAVYDLAVKKDIAGLVLEQFKMNQWDDFLAFPEMMPTLEAFVNQHEAPKGRGRK
ncbi:MAG: recombinase RecT [Deltaproteobacteria bacterium]|nr:recombinase RecT [Deltaproteobacteria bacterium]